MKLAEQYPKYLGIQEAAYVQLQNENRELRRQLAEITIPNLGRRCLTEIVETCNAIAPSFFISCKG